jgi:callose synthase
VEQKKEIYVPYNVLPLDAAGASQAIMQLDEIKAAVESLRNIRGLPWPRAAESRHKSGDADCLDWLQDMFGFQKDNVANQREHLILMLANVHIRLLPRPEPMHKLDDRALNTVMNKLFKNYKSWCKFLGRKHSLWLPQIHQEIRQRKILYMGLYLLIWGEAANLRFMPECLCYIYHHVSLASLFGSEACKSHFYKFLVINNEAQMRINRLHWHLLELWSSLPEFLFSFVLSLLRRIWYLFANFTVC